ncbi:hypothetical protein [Azospirillum halopraeferens]|uniref:hypothetical protein n=1 Tax=Azospirillum halopraeferens TaxID=34010 RepID=UPI000401EA4C|nr:hypothetical protein [Azospirillum halopraeferens]
MRRLILALSLALAVPVAVAAPPAAVAAPAPRTGEERAVAAVFDEARAALAAGRGAAVVPLLSRASQDALERVRTAARAGDRASLVALGPAEKFAALGLRRHLSAAELRRMKVADIADHALAKRWLGPDAIADSALGPVRVAGDRASALLLVRNKPSPVPADFVRENGAWRIDVTGVLKFGGAMLQGMAAMAGKSEEAFIADLLDQLAARRTPAALR